MPSPRTEWQTPVKTLPSGNFVGGGKLKAFQSKANHLLADRSKGSIVNKFERVRVGRGGVSDRLPNWIPNSHEQTDTAENIICPHYVVGGNYLSMPASR